MISLEIPDFGNFSLNNLILDMNGTLSTDGNIKESTLTRLNELAKQLKIHVITADTFGTAKSVFKNQPISLVILKGTAINQKKRFLNDCGANQSVAFGNGNNDVAMLNDALVSICVIGNEGASVKALQAAKIVVKDIDDGLDLLLKPDRLKATLRG